MRCTIPEERNLLDAFVQQPTLPPICLPLLDTLIENCKFWGVEHFIGVRNINNAAPLFEVPVYYSTADLENDLTDHGWNTWQRHPPSVVFYETPKFKLQNVKEEEDNRRKCGCYLCNEWNRSS